MAIFNKKDSSQARTNYGIMDSKSGREISNLKLSVTDILSKCKSW